MFAKMIIDGEPIELDVVGFSAVPVATSDVSPDLMRPMEPVTCTLVFDNDDGQAFYSMLRAVLGAAEVRRIQIETYHRRLREAGEEFMRAMSALTC